VVGFIDSKVDMSQEVLDRLAAIELMLSQEPIISGRYTGASMFKNPNATLML
jgi:hypothetical protein